MTETVEDWAGLAAAIEQRMKDQGWKWVDLKKRGAPSLTKIRDVVHGRSRVMTASKRRDLERALDWVYGSIDDVLAGLEPTVISQRQSPPPRRGPQVSIDLTAIPGDALIEELRRRIRSDLEYLSSKPVRRWTGLVEIIETEGDEDVVEAETEPATPSEAVEAEEETSDEVKSTIGTNELGFGSAEKQQPPVDGDQDSSKPA
jgi:hypothetical protein